MRRSWLRASAVSGERGLGAAGGSLRTRGLIRALFLWVIALQPLEVDVDPTTCCLAARTALILRSPRKQQRQQDAPCKNCAAATEPAARGRQGRSFRQGFTETTEFCIRRVPETLLESSSKVNSPYGGQSNNLVIISTRRPTSNVRSGKKDLQAF